ncbi:hypothetical protein BMH32_01665 [Leucobacter sp. OLJS4]|uniref:DUF4307 domain-containing protein n=1 Tax=unclassified Leucobacter TaxID=2621730 RepID=UPI000C192820|nr:MULTISPECIES: DUF4307 domain-containing protein [unclassified Leucobacter]PIJ47820.1 hypothetical protein BMH30_06585 [Leucobacter sp. OLES1]PII84473.1 hypothetical protein BMH25_04255 [Leucobacter sp. OLCALW19]PII88710.1 hypothetical protein BMH26_04990 [Leucobacter sp. OLTLW20]PII90932.1 hypothetical protein BMH27_09180 [Leucobacter sp. OLAS13]PII97679.1 hypothetical protein BMH29_10700 [Leucobacter sp. OLDS2]
MSEAAASAQTLEDRYGRGTQRRFDRRFAWIIAGVLLLAGLGVLLFSGWQSGSQVEYRDIGAPHKGGSTVTVRFEVTAAPGTRVACAVEALSPSFATVGWKVVELPVSQERTRRFTEELATTYEATAGQVKECWVLDAA